MIDLLLFEDLLKALPPPAQLIMVGDKDQLPAVGPGSIFNDLILAQVGKIINLTKIFRQAEKSLIVVNAHRINQGQMPILKTEGEKNFFFIEQPTIEKIPQIVVDLVTTRLPKTYQYDPQKDIQVISPMYKGETGVNNLNRLLQERLNPTGKELTYGMFKYRVGDKVMQIRNNYEKGVFNGDCGYITRIDQELQEVEVIFDEKVSYDFAELDELTLAYAITVHKSQGSEYKAVIMPLVTQHFLMLQRNLLYTAITRAKELLILIGTNKALAIAVKNDKIKKRFSTLTEKIKKEFSDI
mgnify:CR=1 FL=1